MIPGNHDKVAEFRRAFADQAYLPATGDFINYTIETLPLRLVAVDSVVPGRTRGTICDERLAWLDRTLSQRPDAPTLVMLHHAPWVTGLAHFDEVGMDRSDELERVIARHPQVERVLCGHVHRSTQVRFGGTILSTCPSTAHQAALDLRPDGIDSYTLEPPGFQLHRWTGRRLFTHTLNVGTVRRAVPVPLNRSHRDGQRRIRSRSAREELAALPRGRGRGRAGRRRRHPRRRAQPRGAQHRAQDDQRLRQRDRQARRAA